ncbi:homoserine O-acetyltransferase [Frankia sp. CiP3]|uniref:homoserine O-acetyltransferase MetX n=1 Tax=Frankia sp. CiP3 TaxID=2880971 RepID=UPI0035ABA7E0
MDPAGRPDPSPGGPAALDGRPPPPASAAWRPGSPPGRRRFVGLAAPVALERGGVLPAVTVAYETWGRLAPDASNAVLVLHALSGDSHVSGVAGDGHPTPGWWDGLIGPGRPLDTDQWFVVCPNVLGGCQGSSGPASFAPDGRPWGSRWPEITIADQVRVEVSLADALGIRRWAGVVGGSMGGMRALEWALAHPDRVAAAVVISCGATASAEQIALYSTQIAVIRADPGWRGGDYHGQPVGGGPHVGLGLARQLGQVSYRSEAEFQARFGGRLQPDGRYAAASYVEHHGDKLARRFDAGSYVTLTAAMMSQDAGRGRGGVTAALRGCTVAVTVAGIDSDRLYPLRLQAEMARLLGVEMNVISSPYGHDGFLLETEAVGRMVRATLSGRRRKFVQGLSAPDGASPRCRRPR